MSEKEKNIVPSTAEAEMSEEEKQKLLEQFDKESKTRKFGSPVLKKAYRVFAIIVTLYHLVFASGDRGCGLLESGRRLRLSSGARGHDSRRKLLPGRPAGF